MEQLESSTACCPGRARPCARALSYSACARQPPKPPTGCGTRLCGVFPVGLFAGSVCATRSELVVDTLAPHSSTWRSTCTLQPELPPTPDAPARATTCAPPAPRQHDATRRMRITATRIEKAQHTKHEHLCKLFHAHTAATSSKCGLRSHSWNGYIAILVFVFYYVVLGRVECWQGGESFALQISRAELSSFPACLQVMHMHCAMSTE